MSAATLHVPGSCARESTSSWDQELCSSRFWLWVLSCWKEGMSRAHLKFMNSSCKVEVTGDCSTAGAHLGHGLLQTVHRGQGGGRRHAAVQRGGGGGLLLASLGVRCVPLLAASLEARGGGHLGLLGPEVRCPLLLSRHSSHVLSPCIISMVTLSWLLSNLLTCWRWWRPV